MTHKAWIRVLAATTLLLWRSATASAQVTLTPSPEGYSGAWLFAAPVPSLLPGELAPPVLGGPAATARSSATYRLAAHADGFLDVQRLSNARPRDGRRALLSVVLIAGAPIEAWLFAGSTGPYTVFAGDEPVFERQYATHAPAWDLIPLSLPKGAHPITFSLENRGERWLFASRLLERDTLLPPRDAAYSLPGTTLADRERLLDEMLAATVVRRVAGGVPVLEASVAFPRGAPAGVPLPVAIEIARSRKRLGWVPRTNRGIFPVRTRFPLPEAESKPGVVIITVGSTTRRLETKIAPGSAALAQRSARFRARFRQDPFQLRERSTVLATLEYLEGRTIEGDPGDETHRETLAAWLSLLERRRDPLSEARGVVSVAVQSPLDGALHPLALHVPETYTPASSERYPLVVVLHGYKGTPESVLRAFLDRRSRTPHPSVSGFVLAPEAFGDAFYRGPGETSVIGALDWALRTYPIDPARVSITGVSMGGTGAAHIGFRYADRFAAVAPLAGYHSYFVRRDTAGRRLRDWERARMHHWSPASWAENALHQHVFVAHGTRDFPLENSRVLTRRLGELGYDRVERWPDVGHSVWNVVYAGAAMFTKLNARTIPDAPRRVTLVTDSLRYGSRFWTRIDALEPGHMARLDARVVAPDHVRVETHAIHAFSLARPIPDVTAGAPLTLTVDGQALRVEPHGDLRFVRRGDRFEPGTIDVSRSKRRGVEGAIEDLFLDPVLFVYGTLDATSMRANREVAEHFATAHLGSARFGVFADTQIPEALVKSHSLFLVGSATANALTRVFGRSIALHVDESGLTLGSTRFVGSEVGAMLVHPHPENPERSIVLVVGTDCRAVFRARSLPRLLPDFVVYDRRVGSAAGEQVLGDAKLLASGFFTRDWKLPNLPEP